MRLPEAGKYNPLYGEPNMRWTIILIIGVSLAILVCFIYKELKRTRLRRARFQDREALELAEIYDKYYSDQNLDRDKVIYYWSEVGKWLNIDPSFLRPSDLLSKELAPLKGKEILDEVEDLLEFIQMEFDERKIEFSPDEKFSLNDIITTLAAK